MIPVARGTCNCQMQTESGRCLGREDREHGRSYLIGTELQPERRRLWDGRWGCLHSHGKVSDVATLHLVMADLEQFTLYNFATYTKQQPRPCGFKKASSSAYYHSNQVCEPAGSASDLKIKEGGVKN